MVSGGEWPNGSEGALAEGARLLPLDLQQATFGHKLSPANSQPMSMFFFFLSEETK